MLAPWPAASYPRAGDEATFPSFWDCPTGGRLPRVGIRFIRTGTLDADSLVGRARTGTRRRGLQVESKRVGWRGRTDVWSSRAGTVEGARAVPAGFQDHLACIFPD